MNKADPLGTMLKWFRGTMADDREARSKLNEPYEPVSTQNFLLTGNFAGNFRYYGANATSVSKGHRLDKKSPAFVERG
jgi:hypothetical protein